MINKVPSLYRVAHYLSLLPIVYVVLFLFFIPDGDSYINWLFLAAIPVGLFYRMKISNWSIRQDGALFYPLSIYSSILLFSYVTMGGFASAVKPFIFSLVYLYACLPVLVDVDKLKYLFIISSLEMTVVSIYQHGYLHITRVGGFTNPIFWGIFSLCTSFMCLYLGETVKSGGGKLLFWLASFLSMYSVILSGSRGVWIAAVPIVIIYLVYIVRTKKHWKLFSVVFFGLLFLLFFTLQTVLVSRIKTAAIQTENYISSRSGGDVDDLNLARGTSVSLRFIMWEFSLRVFWENPIFGVGREGAEQAKLRYVKEGLSSPLLLKYQKGHVHNQFLQEIVMRGLVGLSALLALLFYPIKEGICRAKENDWSGYAIISLSFAFLTFCLTEAALKHPYKIYVYVLFMIFLFSFSKNHKKGES